MNALFASESNSVAPGNAGCFLWFLPPLSGG